MVRRAMEAHVAFRAMAVRAGFQTTAVRARAMAVHGLATVAGGVPRVAVAATTAVAVAGIRAEVEEVTPAVAGTPVGVVIPAAGTTKHELL